MIRSLACSLRDWMQGIDAHERARELTGLGSSTRFRMVSRNRSRLAIDGRLDFNSLGQRQASIRGLPVAEVLAGRTEPS